MRAAAAVACPPLCPVEQQWGAMVSTDIQRREICFLVRSVQQIVETDWKQVMPPPKALGSNAFVTGLLDLDGDIIQLMDVELLLSRVYPTSVDTDSLVLSEVQEETLKALNILLVDDSQVARKQLCDVLDGKDIPYQVTTNGDDAMAAITAANGSGKPIDILVSDIEMPGLEGYEPVSNTQLTPPTGEPG